MRLDPNAEGKPAAKTNGSADKSTASSRAKFRLGSKTFPFWSFSAKSDDESLDPQGTAPAHSGDAELAKKLSNPVASLISVPFQSNVDMRMGTGSGWKYTLNIQPVIPIALSPEWNMISRTSIIHQGKRDGSANQPEGVGRRHSEPLFLAQ